MAPSSKAKAAGVSASSFLDLKAELAKKETEFGKKGVRAGAGVGEGVQQGVKKGKGTVWARTNKGVAARAARDIEALAADRLTAESARAALERKAVIYEKLRKGKTGGLTDAQYDALLVDFEAKGEEEWYSSDSEDEDVDESVTTSKITPDEDDPLVEYEDEFGRMRTVRRSEVPRDLKPSGETAAEVDDDDPFIVHNPVDHFPVFEQSSERIAAIQKAAEEAEKPLEAHYDAAREVRAKGAAFYAFSADEEKRAREMEELRRAREETEEARRATGAVDLKAGENEGMVGELTGKEKETKKGEEARSRAMEKRKRELEERRRLVEAKRRKVKVVASDAGKDEREGTNTSANANEAKAEAKDPMTAVETESKAKQQKGKSRRDKKPKAVPPAPSATAADDFLAQLEADLVEKSK